MYGDSPVMESSPQLLPTTTLLEKEWKMFALIRQKSFIVFQKLIPQIKSKPSCGSSLMGRPRLTATSIVGVRISTHDGSSIITLRNTFNTSSFNAILQLPSRKTTKKIASHLTPPIGLSLMLAHGQPFSIPFSKLTSSQTLLGAPSYFTAYGMYG